MVTETIEVLRIPGTLFPRGPYDETETYKFLNIVESGGSGYVCLQPCTGIPVTNTAYWFKFCFKGDKGDAFTYADLTAEQKAELVRDATAAAQAAASSAQSAADDAAAALQKFNTIKAAIDAIDPQSTEGSIQTLAAKQGLLEADLNALGPKCDNIAEILGGVPFEQDIDLTKQTNFTWIDGKAVNATGSYAGSSVKQTGASVAVIDISAFQGKTLTYTRRKRTTSVSTGLIFYTGTYDGATHSADKIANSGVTEATGASGDGEYATNTMTIPSNATYLATTFWTSAKSSFVATAMGLAPSDGLKKDVEDLQEEMESVSTDLNGDVDLTALEKRNGFINNSSSPYIWDDLSSSGRQYVIIPVSEGDIIKIAANDDYSEYAALLKEYNDAQIQDGDNVSYTEFVTIAAGDTYSHTVTSNEKYLYLAYKSGTYIYLAKSVQINPLKESVEGLRERLSGVDLLAATKLRTDVFGGDINGVNIQFEKGHVSISDSGWAFSTDNRRARIERDNPLSCRRGDILKLDDYTAYKMYVGWKVGARYSYNNGWITQDFTCPVDGEYEVLIAKISDEANIATASVLSQHFVHHKAGAINGISSNVKSRSIRSISHQGYSTTSSSYGNNLAESYIKAAAMGFDFGECDFQFSSDGVPFCCHPTKINDVWENAFRDPVAQEYVYFAQNTAAQIKAHAYIDADHTVSTFEEVIAACKSVGLGIYLDKTENILTEDNWTAVFNILKQYVMMDKAVWAVDTEATANKILTYYPCAKIAIYNSVNAANIAMANRLKTPYNEISLDVNADYISAAAIKTAYESLNPGIRIIAFTIDTEAKYRQYMPYVDGIISNTIAEPMLV